MNVLTRKRIRAFFTASLVGLLVSSCKNGEPKNNMDKGVFHSDHLFTDIIIPDGMKICPVLHNIYDINDGSIHPYPRTGFVIMFDGEACSYIFKYQRTRFAELASALGDYPIRDGYIHVIGLGNKVLSTSVEGLSVQALTDYNAKYLKGAELTDIIKVSYESYDYIFPDLLPHEGAEFAGYSRYYQDIPMQSFSPIKRIGLNMGGVIKGLEDSNMLRAEGGPIMSIEFIEAPSTPHQKFLVTLTLGDGTKFEKEIEFDVVEYKPEA